MYYSATRCGKICSKVTAKEFREIALSFPDAEERTHMKHPDFRVRGKIFATLGYPDASRGMVKLTPEQQHDFMKSHPDVFAPVNGAWGLRGCTAVRLRPAKKTLLRPALAAAWRNAAPKSLAAS